MSWTDWFDDIISGPSGGGDGGGRGSTAQLGLNAYWSQVPYIGQYLGYYWGHEDLYVLTYRPTPSSPSSHSRGNHDANIAFSDFSYSSEFGIDKDPDQKLFSNPNLLADNSAPQGTVESWWPSPPETWRRGPEIPIQLADPPLRQPPPRPPEIQDVFVRGDRPDRSRPSPPSQSSPAPLPHPIRPAPYFPPLQPRLERSAPRRPEAAAPPMQWAQEVVINAAEPLPREPEKSDPEALAPQRPEAVVPPMQWAQEVVINAAEPLPFEPEESDPEALVIAKGRARPEWGDVVALARGGYNGLLSAGKLVSRLGAIHLGGPIHRVILPGLEGALREVDKYKLSIDPHHEGAGLIGEMLTENLALEAAPLVQPLGKLVSRAVRSEHFVLPVWGFMGAGVGGGDRISRILRMAAKQREAAYRVVSMSEKAAGFRSVSDPSKTYVHLGDTPARADHAWGIYQIGITGSSKESVIGIVDKNGRIVKTRLLDTSLHGMTGKVLEAKYGDMGQLYNPDRYKHFVDQSHFLIDFAQSAGRPGAQYLLSSPLGASRVIAVFTHLHPQHLRSGFLSVGWFPL